MPSNLDYLRPMLECEPQLERWRVRVQTLESPERGSELELDDRVYRYHRISDVARTSLAAAGEHLRLTLDAIHRQNLYPSAHFTALRGALVGASQAAWVLGPDDPSSRQHRGHIVLDKMYLELKKFHVASASAALTDAQRQELRAHLRWIDERRQQLAAVRTSRTELDLTGDVIPSVAAETFRNAHQQVQLGLLWKQMSSDAHVLGWSTFQRASFGPTDRATGLAAGAAGGDAQQIAQPFIASFTILRRGWSLYDRRCEG